MKGEGARAARIVLHHARRPCRVVQRPSNSRGEARRGEARRGAYSGSKNTWRDLGRTLSGGGDAARRTRRRARWAVVRNKAAAAARKLLHHSQRRRRATTGDGYSRAFHTRTRIDGTRRKQRRSFGFAQLTRSCRLCIGETRRIVTITRLLAFSRCFCGFSQNFHLTFEICDGKNKRLFGFRGRPTCILLKDSRCGRG